MRITPEQVDNEIQKRACLRSFYAFFLEFWEVIESEKLKNNWHIKYICDELQKVGEKIIHRKPKKHDLVINIPPGSTKSTIATVMFPVWLWAKDATIKTISSSYSASLSINHSIKSRDIIKSDKFQKLFNLSLKEDQSGKSHYVNDQGGERMATSTGGTVTGFHAHLILLDDPLNPQMAQSEAERKTCNDYISQTLTTRKIDKQVSATVLIMQRLHQDDPTGNMIGKEKVKHICIPGELSDNVKPKSIKKHYKKNLFDPVRMSKNTLESLKTNLGSYGYAGQIQQQPAPEEGGIWQKDWFQVVEELPKDIHSIATDWDLAYTKKDSNSASAYVTTGVKDNNIFVLDVGYDWLEFPELIKYMKQRQAPHYIEAKASGKSVKQSLVREGVNAIEYSVKDGDKVARARMASPVVEAGRVFMTKKIKEKILHDDKQGLILFPNARHDDLADAFAQAIIRIDSKPQAFIL